MRQCKFKDVFTTAVPKKKKNKTNFKIFSLHFKISVYFTIIVNGGVDEIDVAID